MDNKNITYTSTLPFAVMEEVAVYARKKNVSKNKVIEIALKKLFEEELKKELKETFRLANEDKELIELADSGLGDYLEQLKEFREIMQKEIWMADLNPVIGSEQSGLRPVVIISGETMNQLYSVVIMCPFSSKVKPYKGCPVITPDKDNNLKSVSQAIPFQVRTISKMRLSKRIGLISNEDLKNIKEGLEMFLNY